jgi:hypothetical protein
MSFDLNVNNYKKSELEDIFNLPKNYNSNTIYKNESILRQNTISDGTISESTKQKMLVFIKEVKQLLLKEIDVFSKMYNMDLSLKESVTTDACNTFIINKPMTPYALSLPSEFHKGIINPLKKRTIKQQLNIDSRFRNNYLSSSPANFQFELPTFFTEVVSVQLDAFEYSGTFYNISASMGNNFFYLNPYIIDYTIIPNAKEIISNTLEYTYIIPDGIYIIDTLIGAINTAIQSGINVDNKSIIASANNFNQCIFTSTNLFTLCFQLTLDSIPLPLKLGWLLGYRKAEYENVEETEEIKSEGIIDLYGPKYIFLVFDDYNNSVNNGFFSAFNNSVLNKNILGRISMQPIIAGNMQNNLSVITNSRQYFGPVNIQKIHVQLLDEYGRQLDMHNMDYSFCVTFNVVYDL